MFPGIIPVIVASAAPNARTRELAERIKAAVREYEQQQAGTRRDYDVSLALRVAENELAAGAQRRRRLALGFLLAGAMLAAGMALFLVFSVRY